MKHLSFILLILGLIIFLSSCQRRYVTYNSKGEPIYSTDTNFKDPNARQKDSTDIYGKGYFDYRDTIESFHMGYSIPRDSVYKVENLKAFEALNLLIKKYPLEPGPYLDRGNHYQNIHKYREAIDDYNLYIKLNPYNYSAFQNRGTAHERLKNYDSALSDYYRVTILKPRDTIAYFNRGVVWDALKNYWQAIKEYDTVVMIDPRLAKAYYNRGASFEKVGNFDMAVKNYEVAVTLNPQYKDELNPKIERLK